MDKAILLYWLFVKYSSVQTECTDGLYWAISQIGEGRPQWEVKWELGLKCYESTPAPFQYTWPLLELLRANHEWTRAMVSLSTSHILHGKQLGAHNTELDTTRKGYLPPLSFFFLMRFITFIGIQQSPSSPHPLVLPTQPAIVLSSLLA